MIKGSVQEEDITVVNTYAPNIGAPKYIKQILMRKTESYTIKAGDFNTPLTWLDRSFR